MIMRKVYLQTRSLDEAKKTYFEELGDYLTEKKTETILVREALGRVTANAVYARVSSPLYHSSAMDGIMVESKKTQKARESEPLFLSEEDFRLCDTGDPIVEPYNAVIMVEELTPVDGGYTINKAVHPWENIRPMGEDIIERDLIFPQLHQLKPIDLSVLLAAGLDQVEVYKQPRLAIIPTGDEIVSGQEDLTLGDIIESNSAMFKGMAQEAGAQADVLPVVKDEREALFHVVKEAMDDYDMVCMIAGSSAGRDDYTASIAEELGQVYVHGISIKPGKPAILAKINGKPFVGLPGFPVSGHIIFGEILSPLLRKRAHLPEPEQATLQAKLTKNVVSSLKYQEYVRVKVGKIGDSYSATPMDRGAGASMSLALSDGYLIVPQNTEGYTKGSLVEIRLHEPISQSVLENRLVIIGSHDLVVDVIDNLLAEKGAKSSLVSSHVGSLSGLKSLATKECHLAPSHLLGEDGTYNDQAVRLFFKKDKMVAINVVGRRQGIIVPKGNPQNIQGLQDLPGKRMINRQRGAGTRVLFDYLIGQENLSVEDFEGYDNEATTHLAVALAVKSGDVDFGIGVESAAIKLDCDFIYLADEAYEFITYQDWLVEDAIKEVLEVLGSDAFKREVHLLGGYSTDESGKVRQINVEQ